MSTEPTGKLSFGETAGRIVSGRYAGAFADSAELKALPAKSRKHGMLAVTIDAKALWMFHSTDASGASATVLVPDAGSGRWLATVDTDGTLEAILALTTAGNGAAKIGIQDAANQITATTVEGALTEIVDASQLLVTDLASVATGKGASLIGVEDAGGLFAGVDTVESALAEVKTLADATAAAGQLKASKTVLFSDLTDADQQQDVAFDAALPAGAVIVGYGANVTAAFDNVGDTATLTFDLETAVGQADLVDGGSLNAVAKVATPVPAAGPKAGQLVGAITPTIRFDSDVNLNTLTKGAATFYVLYTLAF